MTSSPNRNNPYAKFDEWAAWKSNDVHQKVAALKDQIDQLKQSTGTSSKPRKGKKGTHLTTAKVDKVNQVK